VTRYSISVYILYVDNRSLRWTICACLLVFERGRDCSQLMYLSWIGNISISQQNTWEVFCPR